MNAVLLSLCSVAAPRRTNASHAGAVASVRPAGGRLIRALRAGIFLTGSAATHTLAAQQANQGGPAAPWESSPLIHVADVDSTVLPCHDFHRYATNGWYWRTPDAHRAKFSEGPANNRIREVLREFVVTAPALAATTADPTTRLVGQFYGSCLADGSGTAPGALGDSTRAHYCFRMTQDSLELALLTVLLERVWPAPARAQSRALWIHMVAAAGARFRTSKALSDSTRQQLLAKVASLDTSIHSKMGRSPVINMPLVWFVDSIAPAWDRAVATQRPYTNLMLSPTDFEQNLARLRSAAAPPLAPAVRETLRNLLAMVLTPTDSWKPVFPGKLIPPRVNDTLDLGGYYGMFGSVFAHDFSHSFDFLLRKEREALAFADEQLKGQLELMRRRGATRFESHPFDDHFGVLIIRDALEQTLKAPGQQPHQRLQGFTPEQRFFLGVAQGWRGGPISGSPLADRARARVLTNGALSAMPAFAQAFGCQVGTPMAGGHMWYQDPWRGVALTPDERRKVYKGFWTTTWIDAFFNHGVTLTEAQQGKQQEIEARYYARRDALIDSLAADTAMSYMPGYRRIIGSFAQYLGDVRALLTPAQQALFDRRVRPWARDWTREHFVVAVPGLPPQ